VSVRRDAEDESGRGCIGVPNGDGTCLRPAVTLAGTDVLPTTEEHFATVILRGLQSPALRTDGAVPAGLLQEPEESKVIMVASRGWPALMGRSSRSGTVVVSVVWGVPSVGHAGGVRR